MTVTTPAGWYPSTTTPGHEQFWDGSAWTDQLRQPAPTGPPIAPPVQEDAKKPVWKRKILWPVYGFIALMIAAGIAGGGESGDDTDVAASSDTTVSEDEASVDEVDDVEALVSTEDESQEAAEDELVSTEDESEETPEEEPEPAAALATRENPVPINQPIDVTAEALGDADDSVWTLLVTGPAQDVTSSAVSEGFAGDPVDGNIVIGVPFEMTLVSANKEPLAPIFNLDVEFFSPTTSTIAESVLACGFWDEAFDSSTETFIGGTISGFLCAEVPAGDLGNGLLITADEDGDRIFMATK